MDIAISLITATSARATMTPRTAGHGLQLQYSTRADFSLAVSPIVTVASDVTTQVDLPGLNQNTGYYVRAREYDLVEGDETDWTAIAGFRTDLDGVWDASSASITHEPAMVIIPQPVLAWHAADEVDGHPAENLGYDAPVAWRSIGTPHSFTVEIAPEPIDTIALLMSNASEATQVTVQAGATLANAQGGAPTFTTGPLDFRASENLPGRPGYHALIRLAAPESFAFWHVIIAGALPGDQLHLEHAIFGLNRATKNHAVDKVETTLDLGGVSRGRSGAPLRALGYRMRKVDFEIAAMSEEQYETIYADIGQKVGLTEPVLIVPNSKQGAFLHDRILYGTLTASQATNLRGPLFTRRFTIESIV
jgi:hypothetical protein